MRSEVFQTWVDLKEDLWVSREVPRTFHGPESFGAEGSNEFGCLT